MTPADFEWLYRASLDPSQAWQWRYGGATPAREQFLQLLHEGVTCQYVVEQRSTGAAFGHVSLYGLHSQGHAQLAAMKDPTFPDRGLMIEAVALFVNYAFRVFPLRNATLSLGGVSGPLIPLDDQIGRKESRGEATMSRRADA